MLDLEGVNFVDSQGSAKLTEIHGFLEADGVDFRIARVKPRVRSVLRSGRGASSGSAPITSTATSTALSRPRFAIDTPTPDRQGVPMMDRASAGGAR